jgi:N-dimethylarginine dimethylaminohydrolase
MTPDIQHHESAPAGTMGIDTTQTFSDGRYHQLLGPEPTPSFEDPAELTATWGQKWGAADEVGTLRSVLMRRPNVGLADVDEARWSDDLQALVDPDGRWYWTDRHAPDLAVIDQQYDDLVTTIRGEGVEIVFASDLERRFTKSIFTRDPLVTVPGGAVIGRLAPRMRRGEEQSIASSVAGAGMPILGTVTGTGLVEGGSFVKVRRDLAFFGTSVRCNEEGYRQLRAILAEQGIELRRLTLPGYLIHLDLCFVMLDHDLAMVNPVLAPFDLMQQLWQLGIETIESPPEEQWACNMLVTAPRRAIVPDHLPRAAELLSRRGVEIVPVNYREMSKNGGSVHCSTMELRRDW